jgi:hypothetical protein
VARKVRLDRRRGAAVRAVEQDCMHRAAHAVGRRRVGAQVDASARPGDRNRQQTAAVDRVTSQGAWLSEFVTQLR